MTLVSYSFLKIFLKKDIFVSTKLFLIFFLKIDNITLDPEPDPDPNWGKISQ